MDFAKALSLIKQIIHEISDMHIKILEICIYDTLYHINVFIYMFRFWDYFQFICDVKQRIR